MTMLEGGQESMSVTVANPDPLEGLTSKQREVLDLLVEHKTSKEISRTLGISPHTVDQRIMLARNKLGLASRNQVAQEYRRLRSIYERPIYQESYVDSVAIRGDELERGKPDVRLSLPSAGMFLSGRETLFKDWDAGADYQVCPDLLDGQWGTLARLGVISGLAVLFSVAILGGISMFTVASQIIPH